MELRFELVSKKIIKATDDKKEMYFTKAEGFEAYINTFYDEDLRYKITVQRVKVNLNLKHDSNTEAVYMSFSTICENKVRSVEVISSSLLGTFISDWH